MHPIPAILLATGGTGVKLLKRCIDSAFYLRRGFSRGDLQTDN
jgi:hypothetical protein